MRARLPAVLLWLVATTAATLLVWSGVGAIGDAAGGDGLAGPAIPATAGPAAAPANTTPDPTGTSDTATTGDTTATSGTAVATTSGPPATVAPAGGAPTSPGPSTTVPAPPPAGQPASTIPATTAPPAALPNLAPDLSSPAAPVTLTLSSEGGDATIRFGADGVTVLAATPAPGFAARVDQRSLLEVRVEFESDDHRSRIEASWDGVPRHTVRED